MFSNLKKYFFLTLFVVMGIFLVSCSKIKDGPAELGDKVFVEYTANFEKFPKIVYDTSEKEKIKYLVLEIGESEDIPKDLQNELVGMKAGEEKTITLKPSQITDQSYDKKKLESEPYSIYKSAGLNLRKGEVKFKNEKYVLVKSVIGQGERKKVVFDMNPLETYNNVIYKIKVLQVGGKELQNNKK